MAMLEMFMSRDTTAWMRTLERCQAYDFYHLPQYHSIAEATGDGEARLFVYTDGDHTLALPLLLRSLEDVPHAAVGAARYRCDATSVYGYAGPVRSHAELPAAVLRGFRSALEERLRELGVVTVFSRLHPILEQRDILAGFGEFQINQTVSIDLTLPAALQRSRYRKSHRESINRLRRRGLTCLRDESGRHLDDFVAIYYETMRRVNAEERYFFPRRYFVQLWEALGPRLQLFLCIHDGRAISAGLFVACCGTLQFHLGGTLTDAGRLAPMKLLIETARLWANEQGLRIFHLGGGVSAGSDDSLLYFKRGFCSLAHEFASWRWVVSPADYDELCRARSQWNRRHRLQPLVTNFFPEYRCPTVAWDSHPSAKGAIQEPAEVVAGERP
jgi:CelD/BcsL family acetyltransferase involved in cellulose biosynthesis